MDYTLYDDDTIRHVVNTAQEAGKNVCLANLYPDADPALKSAFLDAETGLAVEEYDGSLDTAFEKHGFTYVRDTISIAAFWPLKNSTPSTTSTTSPQKNYPHTSTPHLCPATITASSSTSTNNPQASTPSTTTTKQFAKPAAHALE